jgi:excisionase family DNA binding protein
MNKIVASQHPQTGLPRRGFRIPEAAVSMGVTPWYVEEIIRSKQLPALKLGRHYTILREDMDAFLDRKRGEWQK